MEALHPLTARARLVLTAGAGLLLLPLLVIPHGSGGLLSHKAQLHQALSMYHHEEEEEEREGAGEGDAEAGAVGSSRGWVGAAHAGGAEGAPDESLKQPLLEPAGMQRGGTAGAAAEPGAAPSEAAGPAGGARRTGPSSSGAASTVSSAALPELSPAQCLCSSNFWLLFAALTISMGSGEWLWLGQAGAVLCRIWQPHAVSTDGCTPRAAVLPGLGRCVRGALAQPTVQPPLAPCPAPRPHAAEQPGPGGQGAVGGAPRGHARARLPLLGRKLRRQELGAGLVPERRHPGHRTHARWLQGLPAWRVEG